MFDRTTRFFSFSVGPFFSFEIPSPFLLASLFSGFPQKLIDLDHGLFGSFFLPRYQEIYLSILSSLVYCDCCSRDVPFHPFVGGGSLVVCMYV